MINTNLLNAVFSDKKGRIFTDDRFFAGGRYHKLFKPLEVSCVIPLPEDTIIFMLPERNPVVFDKNLQPILLGDRIPVAAFIPPGYTQTLLASFKKPDDSDLILPLFSYAAIGSFRDKLYVAALQTDKDTRHKISSFNDNIILRRGTELIKKFPHNRLIKHLVSKCAFEYKCPNARNLIMNRYEAPLPVSPRCNSQCLGCISFQKKSSKVMSNQNRLDFIPTEEELLEVAEYHINNTKKSIISFGQGCEGEPLLMAEKISKVIRRLRQKYNKNVTININTNGSDPEALKYLFECGLDSVRISLNSAQERLYNYYYKPINYSFDDVLKSISLGKRLKKWISLNYFIFPGVTDSIIEYKCLRRIIKKCKPSMIQLRNLNIDPDWYIDILKIEKPSSVSGIKNLLKMISDEFPFIKFGYFNPYLR